MRPNRAVASAAALLAALTLFSVGACSGGSSVSAPSPTPTPSPTTGGTGTGSATFTDIQTQILTPTCVGCHNANGQSAPGNLNLTAGVSWGNLVNVASSGKPGAIRVIPGDPTNSYLVQKLEGAAGIVGLRMPRNGPPYLTDAQIALVRQWIAGGALNN